MVRRSGFADHRKINDFEYQGDDQEENWQCDTSCLRVHGQLLSVDILYPTKITVLQFPSPAVNQPKDGKLNRQGLSGGIIMEDSDDY